MVAAVQHGMHAIGIDLKKEYCDYVRQRLTELNHSPVRLNGSASVAKLA
jgi:DNA modification methylase